MAIHAHSTLASAGDLSAATWTRHAATLRNLALTGPAQHRHVYESAAREAGANADEAHRAEGVTTVAEITTRLDRAASIAEVADLMLDPAVQQAMAVPRPRRAPRRVAPGRADPPGA